MTLKRPAPLGATSPFEPTGRDLPDWLVERETVVDRMLAVWNDKLKVAKFNNDNIEMTQEILDEYIEEKARINSYRNGDI